MNNYIMGTKRSGLPKSDMIDFIAGTFNNEATKYTCLKYVSKYFDEKTVDALSNERILRKLLQNSTEKVVRNIYELCWQDYRHVAQYRDDNLEPKRPKAIASADGHRYADGDTAGSRNVFMTFEQFSLKEDYTRYDIPVEDVINLSDDIYKRLIDIEGDIKNYIDSDMEIEPAELQERLKVCKKMLNRAIFTINEKASFERKNKVFEKEENIDNITKKISKLVKDMETMKRNDNQEKCFNLLKRCLNQLEK